MGSSQPDSRANSPSWGVRTVSPSRSSNTSICLEMIFRPSASRMTGQVSSRSSMRTSSSALPPWPRPGPMTAAVQPLAFSTISSPLSAQGHTITSSQHLAARMGYTSSGTARVVSPTPERTAARAHRAAAPVYPRLPASMNSLPKSPLWPSTRLGARYRSSRPTSTVWGRSGYASPGMPMSATTTRPLCTAP